MKKKLSGKKRNITGGRFNVYDYTHRHTNMLTHTHTLTHLHTHTYREHNGAMSLSVIQQLSVSGKALHFVLTAHKLCRQTHTHTHTHTLTHTLAQAFPLLTEGGPE